MRLMIVFLLLLSFIPADLLAQSYPLYFYAQHLRISDPYTAALGMSGAAYREGLLAPYTNPAGLARLDRIEIGYSRIPSVETGYENDEDIYGQNTFSIGALLGYGIVAGLSYMNFDMGEISNSDNTGVRQYTLSIAKLHTLSENQFVSIGINVKRLEYLYNILDENSYLFDIGFQTNIKFSENWASFGLALHNLGSDLESKQGFLKFKEKAYKYLQAGIAFGNTKLDISGMNKSPKFMITMEYQKDMDNEFNMSEWQLLGLGFELRFFNYFILQTGYLVNLNDDIDDDIINGMTYGLGFETPEVDMNIPVIWSVHYGRGMDIPGLDVNTISISVGHKLGTGY